MILLDRDGVLNKVVIDPEQGTVDSPLHPSQVTLCDGAAEAVARLSAAGHRLVVVTNQPASAKGKTTRANLDAAHEQVLAELASAGGTIAASFVCHHRSEDGCACRKPRTALLEEAFTHFPEERRAESWMVGDGITDVRAGLAAGVRTAFLAPHKCDHCKLLDERGLDPDFWGDDLRAFTDFLLETEQR